MPTRPPDSLPPRPPRPPVAALLLPIAVAAGLAVPVSAAGQSPRWTTVAAGTYHSCALASDGRAFCWGANDAGQLGDGTLRGRPVPHPVRGSGRFRRIAAGEDHTCALSEDGAAFCWGQNESGALGDGTRRRRLAPVPAASGLTFVTLVAGAGTTCGIAADGQAYCWGDTTGTGRPRLAAPGRRFVSLGLYGWRACGATDDGSVLCWNAMVLGAPEPAAPGRVFTAAMRGREWGCGITAEAEGWCWGSNPYGVLGDGSTGSRQEAVRIAGGVAWRSLEGGHNHMCGLDTDGAARCWGSGRDGELGSAALSSATPVPVAGGHRFTSLAVGSFHACGTDPGGIVLCWGGNSYGQLGDGTTTDRRSPVRLAPPAGDAAVAVAEQPPPTPPPPPGAVVLPPGHDAARAYPVVVFLPFTGGTAEGTFDGYRDQQRDYIAVLPYGEGEEADYLGPDAWWNTILRYERQVMADLARLAAAHRVDTTRIVLAGYSLGGDLAWALTLKNPARFRGAIVMGSRAGYRGRAADHRALASRGARFFFALGDHEERVRVDGARAAVGLLESLGVAYRWRDIPQAGHAAAPPPMFAEALAFLLER